MSISRDFYMPAIPIHFVHLLVLAVHNRNPRDTEVLEKEEWAQFCKKKPEQIKRYGKDRIGTQCPILYPKIKSLPTTRSDGWLGILKHNTSTRQSPCGSIVKTQAQGNHLVGAL